MTAPPTRTLAGKWLGAAFLLLAAAIFSVWYSANVAYEAAVLREALWSGALSALLVLALGLVMLAWRRHGQSELALAQQAAAKEALAASEARFRKLHEHGWDFNALFDRDMVIRYASPSIDHYLGRKATSEDIGAGTAWVHPDDVARVEAARRAALERPGKPQCVEHRLARGDGGWLTVESCFTSFLDDPDIGALAYTARDITERKQAEAQRLAYAAQQRDTLVREVHHRIKNHLQGLAGLLNQHRRQHPDQHDTLDAVIAQITTISVIHGLQGREASGEVCLFLLLKEIVSFLRSRAALDFGNAGNPVCRNCAWRVVDEESVPLALVINELVTNAINHRGKPSDAPPVPVRIDCACNDESIAVTVRNRGALPRGFDFAAGAGLGTGLTLVRSLLPREGTTLSIAPVANDMVETRLTLTTPAVSGKREDQVVSRR